MDKINTILFIYWILDCLLMLPGYSALPLYATSDTRKLVFVNLTPRYYLVQYPSDIHPVIGDLIPRLCTIQPASINTYKILIKYTKIGGTSSRISPGNFLGFIK